MLPIRSEDSLTIPLYHLSQGKIKTFPKGANMGQTKYKLKGKILKAEKTSALGTNSKCFSCVNSVASSNKLTSHLVLFCPYYNTETEAVRTCSRSQSQKDLKLRFKHKKSDSKATVICHTYKSRISQCLQKKTLKIIVNIKLKSLCNHKICLLYSNYYFNHFKKNLNSFAGFLTRQLTTTK